MIVPEAAQQRVKSLYAAYALSRQELASFVTGLLLGMGLNPAAWELDTTTMTLRPQEPQEFQEPQGSTVGANGARNIHIQD